MITLITDRATEALAQGLSARLQALGQECSLFQAAGLDIRPCRACGSCSGRTYRRCVLKDDMAGVLRAMAVSRATVWMGPVSFGGHSGLIKTMQDRSCTLGDPHYHIRRGEMVKAVGLQQGARVHSLGLLPAPDAAAEQAFRLLHREQLHIMDREGECFLLYQDSAASRLDRIAGVIAHA